MFRAIWIPACIPTHWIIAMSEVHCADMLLPPKPCGIAPIPPLGMLGIPAGIPGSSARKPGTVFQSYDDSLMRLSHLSS